MKFIDSHLNEASKILGHLNKNQIKKVIDKIEKLKKIKGRIFFLGVGGSAANASHAVNDFRKLCNIECYSPADNISELTARINDDGWNKSYKDWLVVSRLKKKDMLFIFSVGGGSIKKNVSMNIVEAIKYAKKTKAKVVGVVGRDGGYTKQMADACILIPTVNNKSVTPHCEAFQAIIWHLIISHPKIKVNKTKW